MKLIDEDLVVNFGKLEDIEIKMIEVAHQASMSKESAVATHGRALKHFVPAWIDFVRQEMERDEHEGPGNTVYAITRAFSLMAALTALGTMKEAGRRATLSEALGGLFSHDIDYLLTKGKVNGISGENESPTTH